MPRLPQLTIWRQHLATRLPQLTASVVANLATYSCGVVLAQGCSVALVATVLAQHLGERVAALRKRLSEFYKEAPAKSGVNQGQKRRDFDVTTCFPALLTWVIHLWTSGKYLPLAMDVTNLGERFHVLCISVVVRGTAIPVAWSILPGGEARPWHPEWERLLKLLQPAVPADWQVFVLTDRGLESARLFQAITAVGWHPLMRVKKGGTFRAGGAGAERSFASYVPSVGDRVALVGHAYGTQPLACTLLGCWDAGHAEPWLLLSDVAPGYAQAVWYAYRSWIEQGFKWLKSGGWQWQRTRMEDAGRAERLWLVLAVATLWVTALGAADEVHAADERERQRTQEALEQTAAEQAARAAQKQRQQERHAAALRRRAEQRAQRRAAREQARAAKQARQKPATPPAAPARGPVPASPKAPSQGRRARRQRVARRGLTVLLALWLSGSNALPEQLHPEAWPPNEASVAQPETFTPQQT